MVLENLFISGNRFRIILKVQKTFRDIVLCFWAEIDGFFGTRLANRIGVLVNDPLVFTNRLCVLPLFEVGIGDTENGSWDKLRPGVCLEHFIESGDCLGISFLLIKHPACLIPCIITPIAAGVVRKDLLESLNPVIVLFEIDISDADVVLRLICKPTVRVVCKHFLPS